MKTSLLASASAIRSACLTPAAGAEPVQHAAEGDHPDAVARAQVGLGQPGGGPDGERQRALAGRWGREVGEGVDEDEDVRRALGVALGDEGLAAARRRAPVQPPRVVARHPRPHLGQLEALAARARAARPDRGLRARRRHQRAQPLDARQHAHGGLGRRGPGEPDGAHETGGAHARAAGQRGRPSARRARAGRRGGGRPRLRRRTRACARRARPRARAAAAGAARASRRRPRRAGRR